VGTLDLLDVLKDADFLADFTTEFTSVASRGVLGRHILCRRLLLCLFALGTNMGIKAIASTGEHGETEAALRHVRRHHITRDNLRRAIAKLVNATFDARDPGWWGSGTACSSDSKKFGSCRSTRSAAPASSRASTPARPRAVPCRPGTPEAVTK